VLVWKALLVITYDLRGMERPNRGPWRGASKLKDVPHADISDTETWICLFVCLLLNGTSALFRPLVPRIVEVEDTRLCINDS